ncbi:hypothetical protein BKA65DRAFT_483338 [Rhexocercosporidium sp. MPI-PUGE-AT-0058]|nr:hypothetical protein BKA65DRAFT_483338 [Rhexocercosporidium sp. MPI-PUGE-AT-0058]
MFCQSDIFEDAEDILCPLAREIKETGWRQIKKLCIENDCQFCDQLRPPSDDSEQERHEDGFLIWPRRYQGSIYDVKSVYRSDSPPQFPLEKLPADLIQYLIRYFLVADEPITNPQLQNKKWHQKDPGTAAYTEGGVVRYKWSKYMRPAILATNKTYHLMGSRMLYRYNTFRFTRLVAQANNQWADFCTRTGERSRTEVVPLDEFLKTKVSLFDASGLYPTTRVSRSFWIKNVIIEDSDLDSDHYAKRGISKLKSRVCSPDKYRYVFYIINKFIRFGGKISDLTITIDEEEPGVLEQLNFEEALVSQSQISEEESEQWESFIENVKDKVWTKNWIFTHEKVPAKRVSIDHIHIRGTDALNGGDLKFRYFEGRSIKMDGTHVSGSYAPTNKVAKSIVKYFNSFYDTTLLRRWPIISFTGRFHQRRLKEDGSWVPDDELDGWLAKEAQQAFESTDPDEEAGEDIAQEVPPPS